MSELITIKEAEVQLGTTSHILRTHFRDCIAKRGTFMLYDKEKLLKAIEKRKEDEIKAKAHLPNCKGCGEKHNPSKNFNTYGYCLKPKCQQDMRKWMQANFDLLNNSNIKKRYEEEFYKLNEVQKKHYANFLSLMRPKPKTYPKGRRCLDCRATMEYNTERNDYRICSECKIKHQHIGALAEC